MVGPIIEKIALSHILVSFRMYIVFFFVAYINGFADKGEKNGRYATAIYQENLNPEPLFKRALLARQIFLALTRYIEPVMTYLN